MAVLFSLGGPFEPNLENEGSISGSDSAFYRQSEGEAAGLTAAGKAVALTMTVWGLTRERSGIRR